jgi:hypothetical protein
MRGQRKKREMGHKIQKSGPQPKSTQKERFLFNTNID